MTVSLVGQYNTKHLFVYHDHTPPAYPTPREVPN